MFVQLGLQLISDMSMRIYSEASIAENPLLGALIFPKTVFASKHAWNPIEVSGVEFEVGKC